MEREQNEGVRSTRPIAAAGLLVGEAGLAALGVLLHYGLAAEYGDVTDSTMEGLMSGFSTGTSGVALVIVGVAALVVVSVSPKVWMRQAAVAIPVLMVVGMLVVTPAALRQKLEAQYDPVPQCVTEAQGSGSGSRAERESQQAFDSIEHVGHFGGGGWTGVDGCQRSYVLTENVDVLQHYRAKLPEAGWRVVEDDAHRLRAERAGMAFEVATCDRDGVVWAGRQDSDGKARCE